MLTTHCNICGSAEFADFNGRKRIRCTHCQSMDRSRLMYALLERRGQVKKGLSVLHFAPDQGLALRVRPLATTYVTADLNAQPYKLMFPDTLKIDLCNNDLSEFRGKFDLVLHNHVLEHLPCSLPKVLGNLAACLNPGGEMYFSTPIRKGVKTEEEFGLGASGSHSRFGQDDHVRMLGDIDALSYLQISGTFTFPLDPLEFLSAQELKAFRIPSEVGLTGTTIFCCNSIYV